MKYIHTLNHWYLKQAEKQRWDEVQAAFHQELTAENKWLSAENGLQVHEVLLKEKIISDDVLLGITEDCKWVAKENWIYACSFVCEKTAVPTYLHFGGIDTVADIYLNGEMIAHHDDMYLPLRLDISKTIKESNRLIVYFYSPEQVVKQRLDALPEETRSRLDKISIIRKCCLDFGDFGGVTLTNVGLFEDVTVEYIDQCELDFIDVETTFKEDYSQAHIQVQIAGTGAAAQTAVSVELRAPSGEQSAFYTAPIPEQEHWSVSILLTVDQPQLWWPKNYGEQPLYTLHTMLGQGQRVLDVQDKVLGLRCLEKTGDMRFRVNRKEIKLWGGNLVPPYGFTHRWNDRRCDRLMERIALSNMNCVRLWGGGMPFGDGFYEACNRMGIMVYQDFYLNWAYYLETADFREKFYQEALYQVKRLKHHPSILLWSGGNETYMHHEENSYEKPDLGYAAFKEDFARACREIDPNRFYLVSSPSGGDYPSDPSEGDGHPLYYTYRHKVEKYPVFVSESARTSTGPLRSLKRFMGEDDIWPKDYVSQVTYPATLAQRKQYFTANEKFFIPLWKKVPIPDTWSRWSAGFFAGESASVEKFYEAHDAESLVYRYNAAYADFMKNYSEGVRRGKGHFDTTGKRIPTGYLLWKINDTWPQFYCSLIDYFLETYIPFYQVKRSFAPVLLSFEDDDHILLWGVNDTGKDITAQLHVLGFSMANNKIMSEFTIPVFIRSGESKVLTDLDRICPVIREWVLFAQLKSSDGTVIAQSDRLMELERYLMFPEAKLSLQLDGDELVITTDRFAHCVELTGNDQGDEFGWLFEDNYFNLFPFETKRIGIQSEHQAGIISAKAHYSETITTTDFTKGCKRE